jgi:hypothetical protein
VVLAGSHGAPIVLQEHEILVHLRAEQNAQSRILTHFAFLLAFARGALSRCDCRQRSESANESSHHRPDETG